VSADGRNGSGKGFERASRYSSSSSSYCAVSVRSGCEKDLVSRISRDEEDATADVGAGEGLLAFVASIEALLDELLGNGGIVASCCLGFAADFGWPCLLICKELKLKEKE